MSTQTDAMPDKRKSGSEGNASGSRPSGPSGPSKHGLEGLAEQLVAQAREQGIALTGPGGLLSGLTRQVLETALESELTEHLGHEHGGVPGPGGNVRNGHSAKTVRTEIGDVRVRVPRDRGGSFEPVMVPVGQASTPAG